MSKPRIVTVTDHVDAPTGFGRQHKMLCEALAATGKYELFSFGMWDDGPIKLRDGYESRPVGAPGQDAVATLKDQWAHFMRIYKPDILIAIGDLWMFPAINDHKPESFDWISWLPIDAAPFPATFRGPIGKMSRLVHMSEWGATEAEPILGGTVRSSVIPLSINPSVFHPVTPERKGQLREYWSRALNFDLVKAKHILICHDTNAWRKNTPELLRMLESLPQDTVLILHCTETAPEGSGGWDLKDLAKNVFRVYNRTLITGKGNQRLDLPEADLASLVQACDIRVSATTGEGFGVCHIECAACGLPTVTTDYTTSAEIVGPDADGRAAGLLARVACFSTQAGAPFQRAHVDAADMAAKVKVLCDDADLYRRCSEEGVRRVREKYTTEIIGRQWVELLEKHLRGRA